MFKLSIISTAGTTYLLVGILVHGWGFIGI